ncbi:hypothetical protein M8C21_009543 [Ambrosia artemisiifolia]|uniref:Uncharacterized protein n=1 Tax=Ambrosia artemisiifolia TaxID=4212 RepID=A0AAD5GGI1_AMBAR|nr:hypothetical protein M8C21_009543 [Ambrosia artemisiifolia]
MEVARKGEDSGYGVPCLLISAKNDLNLYPMAIKDSEMAVKINAPICISAKEKYMNNVFQKIVTTAQKCHLSVPETEHGRNKKRYRQLVNRSLVLASVGAAIAIVALAAYRAYACRKVKSPRQA